MPPPQPPGFLYDFNSPYAYLASTRVDALLPVRPDWEPVALAFVLRAHRRDAWSFASPGRELGMAECERRADAYGLPPLRWPPGWPVESYGLNAPRAALIARDHGLLRPFSHAAFARTFVTGEGVTTVADVLAVAEEVGLDRDSVAQGIASSAIKQRLTAATEAALTAGIYGVPSVRVGDRFYWGDDRLPDAAAALTASAPGAGS